MADHTPYVIAVRALCEFTAKQGDLDLRFTPAPSAQQGIAGHTLVASRRGADYQSEVSVEGEFQHLKVRGRLDGYDPTANRLEEIKTHRGALSRMPDNHRQLHWAQVRVYGSLLCRKLALDHIDLALVYLDIDSREETVLIESWSASDLHQRFEAQCALFLIWADKELRHRAARDAALDKLPFTHGTWRAGQRQLAEATYRSAAQGRHVMAQAPTGIGKTLATLFPLLRAMPRHDIDKIVFLTAKTSGRAMALDALTALGRDNPIPLRVIEIVARDKACEFPDNACHGEACPLACGFYDRLPAAREQAVGLPDQTRSALREVALAHKICPYYLTQDLVRWADVIIGDYNYWFDMSAMLYALTLDNQWRVGLLVDEAHNLVERGRQMYTGELAQAVLKQVRKLAPASIKKPLDRFNREWNALSRSTSGAAYHVAKPPARWLDALQVMTSAITEQLVEQPAALDPTLMRFYFDAMYLGRLVELAGDDFLFDITASDTTATLRSGGLRISGPPGVDKHAKKRVTTVCVRNVVPARLIKPRLMAAHSSVLFSATLAPEQFYRDMLGLPEHTVSLDVAAPFDAAQLSVHIARRISTRYQHREASVRPIVELMARQYAHQPGNYLAFFSSYDYLTRVADAFEDAHPATPSWRQAAGMTEGQREAFLARFTPQSRGIGFAVLGGSFAEGVDLPGSRLIGAFIATLGLPQLNPVNEQMRQRIEALCGSGYDYTYLFPGLQKVVQAAGRVIRSPSDRGTIHLIDDRFGRSEIRRLLPSWWRIDSAPAPDALAAPEKAQAADSTPCSATNAGGLATA